MENLAQQGNQRRNDAVRAAEYVRMSRDLQEYSTQNQRDAIRKFAESRGLEIVRTYADEGKSGLRLNGRNALKQLIDDVQSGKADFSAILVYDVSRWGRFQDADESAYYEYLCRRAGIDVQYCAEQFENDGSATSTIVKGVKRAMASEYSRELSVKVHAGQSRIAALGFRAGGRPGFGLRRMLVDSQGSPKRLLQTGELKNVHNERVILVHGPPEEVETVRWIFRSFAKDGNSESEIAQILNDKGILTHTGRQWSVRHVQALLANEKYIGANIWNRISHNIGKKSVKHRHEDWVRHDDAFEAIVDPSLFEAAKTRLEAQKERYDTETMLRGLKELYEKHGYLRYALVDAALDLPNAKTYVMRFGTMCRAYELVGYAPDRSYLFVHHNRGLRGIAAELVADVTYQIKQVGADVTKHPRVDLLTVNDEVRILIVLARNRMIQSAPRWDLRRTAFPVYDIAVVARMDPSNQTPLDYFLLPSCAVPLPNLRIAQSNGLPLDAYRVASLDALIQSVARKLLSEFT